MYFRRKWRNLGETNSIFDYLMLRSADSRKLVLGLIVKGYDVVLGYHLADGLVFFFHVFFVGVTPHESHHDSCRPFFAFPKGNFCSLNDLGLV